MGCCAWVHFMAGGSTLYIETTLSKPLKDDDTGAYTITGSLGDVMKESVSIAHTVAKNFLMEKQPDNAFLQKANIHIHVPEVSAAEKDFESFISN